MAKYGNVVYGGAKYGATPKLALSAEPMSLTVLDFNKVYVTWQSPTGSFSRIRLVRNQIGFPETAEDGIIVWDEFATSGNLTRLSLYDVDEAPIGTNPIVPGSQIYYRIFLYITPGDYWVVAGEITDSVPSDHKSHAKFMDVIPKVYTSDIQSPLGVTDTTSALYNFMEGLSFTYEQLLTQLDLLRPNHSSETTAYALLPVETLNVGLTTEPILPVKSQKRLVRESLYMYSHKGLKDGVGTYVESLTNYPSTITVSPNLLLSIQDSTFLDSVGNWTADGCTLEASDLQVPVITDYVIDTVYSGKVTAIGSSSITLGFDDPVTFGIPVKELTDYTFGYKYKSPGSAGNVQLTVYWFNRHGENLELESVGTSNAANNTWKTSWETLTSPADAVYACLKLEFSASGIYFVDQISAEEGENLDDTSYQEARSITIYLDYNKANFIKNPSFELNTNQWTITADAYALDTDVPNAISPGSNSLSVDITSGATLETSTDEHLQVLDKYYTLSFYAKASNFAAGTVTMTPRDGGVPIVGEEQSIIHLTTDWTRYSITSYVDAANILSALSYDVNISINALNGETIWVDCVQLEASPFPSDYVDGGMDSRFGAIWEDTPHESDTYVYVGKIYKIPRLAQTIDEYLPMNSYWIIKSAAGVEYTSLTV